MQMMMVRKDARMLIKEEQAAIGQVLPNFLAGEKEQPLEREFNLDFDLLFDTTDNALLNALPRPDGWNHARICKDIVV